MALAVGVLLLDVAMQSGMTVNLTRIHTIRPDHHGRLNTAFMTCAFLGGSTGSWLGVHLHTELG